MHEAIIEIDLHGLNAYKARSHIDAALRKASGGVYIVRLVHGYNRGTIIRDMIHSTYANHPKVIRIRQGVNPGITELVLREL